VRDPQRNHFPHIDCFAYLLPRSVPWREHFDYLARSAQKENPAAFPAKQKVRIVNRRLSRSITVTTKHLEKL
jgi:hypothetical protein